jgi:ABC-type antimicrobial peptide transport system permease subunit
MKDLRYGLRMLAKHPGVTITVVLTLALGIGANTAVFSLIDAFLLRQLPVKAPHELVFVETVAAGGQTNCCFPYSTYEQLRDRSNSFAGVLAVRGTGNTKRLPLSVTVDGRAEVLVGDFVSGNYFDVLGVGATAGRTLTVDDDRPGTDLAAVISYTYWDRRFARDPAVVGKTIYAGKIPFTVVGITPPDFFGRSVAGRTADITLPAFIHPQLRLRGESHITYEIMARLKPGVSLEQARADLDIIFQQILISEPAPLAPVQDSTEARAQQIALTPAARGQQNWINDLQKELPLLFAVVGVVLLIACVNVANLLLSRASARRKEIGIRLSLGASRGRLVRQLLAESLLLSLAGGGLGVIFSMWGVDFLLGVLSIPAQVSPDLKMLGFTGAVSILTGLLFGLIPAMALTRIDLVPILKGIEGGSPARTARLRLAKSLVIVQVALSLVLLIGAGLLISSLKKLSAVDTGFEREKVLKMWIHPALIGYDHAKELRLYRDLLDRVSATAGVESASLSRFVAGRGGPIGPRYFETMGIGLVAGREFTTADTPDSPKVAIISESAARKFFPTTDPVGQFLPKEIAQRNGGGDIQIVGVVRDIKERLRQQNWSEAIYTPYTQAPPQRLGQVNLFVRASANPNSLIPALHEQAQALDKDLALNEVMTQAEETSQWNSEERSLARLLTFFGVLALVLASIGLYGTMSYAVGRRTKELGIRIALGARRGRILRMVLGEALLQVAIGVAIGIPVAIAATRLISSSMFGVTATDPATISVALLVMLVIALIAGYLPARRATKVDPMVALRYE